MVEIRAIRYLVRDRARLVGDRSTYERLGLEGPEGYPGLDDVRYLAAVLGGTLVAQIGEAQVLLGEGPLLGHLHSRVSTDGAGHSSMHWKVFQSWVAAEGNDAEHEVENEDTLPAASLEEAPQGDLDPLLQKCKDMPGAETSYKDFEALFAALSSEMTKDEGLQPDEPREESTLVGNALRIEKLIEDAYPNWPAELKHLALIALHIYKCRLADVYMREYVMLTHVILGRGREFLRAHERTTYIWSDPHGVWHRYEGLLPEDVYTLLKRTLLILEGLLRTLAGEVDRTDDEVL